MEDCRERWRCSESEDKHPAVDSVKKYIQRETDVRKPARGQRETVQSDGHCSESEPPNKKETRFLRGVGVLFKVMNI